MKFKFTGKLISAIIFALFVFVFTQSTVLLAQSGAGNLCSEQSVLKLGSTGDCVKLFKSKLSEKAKLIGAPSFDPSASSFGNFDANTESAVRAWQRTRGLKDDGIVGPKTWSSVNCEKWDDASATCKDVTQPQATPPTTQNPPSQQTGSQAGDPCNRLSSDIAQFGDGQNISSIVSGRCYTTGGLISKIVSWLIGLSGAIAVLIFMYGGYRYMVSAGNAEAATAGKKIMQWALIGLVVVILAYTVVSVVTRFILSGEVL